MLFLYTTPTAGNSGWQKTEVSTVNNGQTDDEKITFDDYGLRVLFYFFCLWNINGA